MISEALYFKTIINDLDLLMKEVIIKRQILRKKDFLLLETKLIEKKCMIIEMLKNTINDL